ncbi:MAG: hypothetical protein AB7O56_03155 [Bauldia sp.]
MEAAGLDGAPFNRLPFAEFRASILVDLGERYVRVGTLTWENTLAAEAAPANPNGWGAADLAAALLYVIYAEHGQAGLEAFWRAVATMPAAGSPADAIRNLVMAARTATGADYRPLYRGSALEMDLDSPAGAPLRIAFTNGAALVWTGAAYVEQPGGSAFAIQSMSDTALTLHDASRDISWEIPLVAPAKGAWSTRWFFSGNFVAAYDVAEIAFP